jgi:hypothetical protein
MNLGDIGKKGLVPLSEARYEAMFGKIIGWLGPRRDARLLQAIAFLRSVGQGMALVDVGLYLKALGWSGGSIGAVLAGAGLVRTFGMLFAREWSALLGAKRFLLLFETLTALAALAAAVTSVPAVLALALIAAGLGSGHSGSGGPTAPIERAWLAAYARRGSQRLFHVNALLGYLGLGAGALLGCLPSWGIVAWQGADSFRPLFALMAFVSAISAALTLRIQGGQRKSASPADADAGAASSAPAARSPRGGLKLLTLVLACVASLAVSSALRRRGLTELSLLVPIAAFIGIVAARAVRLILLSRAAAGAERAAEDLRHLSNVLGGVVATLTGTMTSYWFSARFAASAGAIGAVMGASYLAAALLSLRSAHHSRKRDTVRSILWMQLAAVAFLLVLPWASSFWLAAGLEIGCTALNLGTRGNRTAILMEEPRRGKGSASARFYYLLVRIGAVLWPGAFGRWIEYGEYVAPFYIVAGLQSAAALLYARVFRRSPPPGDKALDREPSVS